MTNLKVKLPIPALKVESDRTATNEGRSRGDSTARIKRDDWRDQTFGADYPTSQATEAGAAQVPTLPFLDLRNRGEEQGDIPYVEPSPWEFTNESNERSDPVNPSSGEFWYKATDLEVPGVGMHLAFVRTYRSRLSYRGPIGSGWTHNYDQGLFGRGAEVVPDAQAPGLASIVPWEIEWKRGDGTYLRFKKMGGVWATLDGSAHRLTRANGSWIVTQPNGNKVAFDSDGLLVSMSDLSGNAMGFEYEPDPTRTNGRRLRRVSDTMGRGLMFRYYPDGLLQSVALEAQVGAIRFSYQENPVDSQPDLVSVTNQDNLVEQYEYDTPESGIDTTLPTNQVEAYCKDSCDAPTYGRTGPRDRCSVAGDRYRESCVNDCVSPSAVSACTNECTATCPGSCAGVPGIAACSGMCTTDCTSQCQANLSDYCTDDDSQWVIENRFACHSACSRFATTACDSSLKCRTPYGIVGGGGYPTETPPRSTRMAVPVTVLVRPAWEVWPRSST